MRNKRFYHINISTQLTEDNTHTRTKSELTLHALLRLCQHRAGENEREMKEVKQFTVERFQSSSPPSTSTKHMPDFPLLALSLLPHDDGDSLE